MNKDNFEIQLGRKLRNVEAPVDPAIWANISSRISPTVHPALGGMGFALGIATGIVLLSGLAIYSFVKPDVLPLSAAPALVIQQKISSPIEVTTSVISVDVTFAFDNQTQDSNQVETVAQTLVVHGTTDVLRDEPIIPAESNTEQPTHAEMISGKDASTTVVYPNVVESKEATLKPKTSSLEHTASYVSAKIKVNTLVGYTPLIVNFENDGFAENHHWDFGIKGKSELKQATVLYTEPGIYSAYLNVEDRDGNTKIDMVTINVMEGSNLVAPDSFTPNGDGLNDTYKVEGLHITEFHLTIVNSKGKPVYETHNITSGWVFEPNVHAGYGEFYIAVVKARGVDGKEYSFIKKLTIIY